jgi:hypothetical protein
MGKSFLGRIIPVSDFGGFDCLNKSCCLFLGFPLTHIFLCSDLSGKELEDFLITNRPEYLRHSAQNYTLEQKDYNNTLTARVMEYAEQCGYGNLLHYPQDFGSFTAVRDRIRGYYKSYLQSSRRREQRRQKRLDKQHQKQMSQHHRAVGSSSG